MKQIFVFLILVICGVFCCGGNTWAAQDKFHVDVKTGNGYIELPVNAHIIETYSKGDSFSFVALDVSGKIPLPVYIVDWNGHTLWASGGHDTWPSPNAEAYLKKNGWAKLEQGVADTFYLQNHQSMMLLGRMGYTDIWDACLHAFNMYLKAEDGSGNEKNGTFIRLLDHAEEQDTPFGCDQTALLRGNGKHYKISTLRNIKTRLVQISFMPQAEFYKIRPDEVLLVDHSVAILLKPNLDFYANHPTDYHYISADESYEAEKRAVLSVFNGDVEAYKKEGRNIQSYSAFQTRRDQLSKAEKMLVDDLDQIFKRQKDGN